ncbi:MAG: ABC transporter ATP-binding protein [Bacteroidota bacterium]|nr:ABC transporter ATP-binding protein [Bacteroidota bacterium]
MNQSAISTSGLGKRYLLGERGPALGGRTLRDAMGSAVGRILRKEPRRDENPEIWALRDISLEVHEGEIVGIVGRNGAGKTTLLKILSRITRPTEGRARVRGRVASLLEVGTGFHRELTGRENIRLSGAVLGMRRAETEARFDEIVSFAGVEDFLDTPVKHYSTGMYLRLAFSVAAHLQPDILLVDEILAVGDLEFQKKCLGKMGEVVRGGRTILFVSHNLPAVQELCPRTILIDGGRILQDGRTDEVLRAYVGMYDKRGSSSEITPEMHDLQYNGDAFVRLLRVELENPYAGSFAVRWREPIRLTFHFEVRRDLPDAVFGLRVDSMHGTAVFGSHHTDGGDAPFRLPRGTYSLSVIVENPLQAGRFSISIGAHSAVTRDIYFLVPHAVSCEVLDIPFDAPRYIGKHLCLVNGDAQWSKPEPFEP